MTWTNEDIEAVRSFVRGSGDFLNVGKPNPAALATGIVCFSADRRECVVGNERGEEVHPNLLFSLQQKPDFARRLQMVPLEPVKVGKWPSRYHIQQFTITNAETVADSYCETNADY